MDSYDVIVIGAGTAAQVTGVWRPGRGPMPLDTHLYRARLFGLSKDRPATYPWTSPRTDLAEARRLIEEHGYWRRKEELEDAEKAALAVPAI